VLLLTPIYFHGYLYVAAEHPPLMTSFRSLQWVCDPLDFQCGLVLFGFVYRALPLCPSSPLEAFVRLFVILP